MKSQFQFVELTKYTKLYKNNQQAGSLTMRLTAFLYACKYHFSRGVQMALLNTPRKNMVKLYQVQCSNESLLVRTLSKLELMSLYPNRRLTGYSTIIKTINKVHEV